MRVRTGGSSGGRPARSATASARIWIVLANSSSMRARTAGTDSERSVVWRSWARSSADMPANASWSDARMAAIVLSPAGWARSASIQRSSMSSCRTTSSLVGK